MKTYCIEWITPISEMSSHCYYRARNIKEARQWAKDHIIGKHIKVSLEK